MFLVAVLIVLLVLVLLAIELLLWGLLLSFAAVVVLILHGAGVLETVASAIVVLAIIAGTAWAGFQAAKSFGLPLWTSSHLDPPSANLPPADAHERYLWANRLGPYADDP